ncbi:MAG: type II secretion system F family protein [Planctomycetota bacterium]
MSTFMYSAVTPEGVARKGRIEASSERDALDILTSRGLYPQAVSTVSGGFRMPGFSRGISSAAVGLITRQFESILGAGLTVEEALVFVARSTRDERVRSALEGMLNEIRGGSTLSAAAARYPQLFNGFYVGMLAAGEATGDLEHVMARIAEHLERQAAVRRRVTNAMVYPVVVLLAGIALMAAMMTYIVPQFAGVVLELGVDVPVATRVVLGISAWLQAYGWMLVLLVVGAIAAFTAWRESPKGKRATERVMLGLPLFGPLLRQQLSASFASSLAFALESGLEILAALDVARSSSNSPLGGDVVERVKEEVRLGTSVPDALREHSAGVMDPLLVDMAAAGVRAGEMPALLLRAAAFFEANVQALSEGVLRAVEPILIVVIGIVAAGTVVALFSPIISLTQQVGNF